jgi:hypothetical protein
MINDKLFEAVHIGHDGRNRIVVIAEAEGAFYVYKPASGFKSKSFTTPDDPALVAIFNRQCACSRNVATYEESDRDAFIPEAVAAEPEAAAADALTEVLPAAKSLLSSLSKNKIAGL